MHFKMFTEHEVELFALHINFFNLNEFFLSIRMQHTDKIYQESGFLGAFFWYCVLQDRWSFWGLHPLDPQRGICPAPTGGLAVPPDNQLIQEMKYGHCISCFREDATFIHALTTDLAHHSKFLKKRPGMSQHVTCGPVFSTSEQGPLAGSQLKCPLGTSITLSQIYP